MSTIPFIVTETPNGRATVKNAFVCLGESDFISRIAQTASRSDDVIDSVGSACQYLSERHAQRTAIITKEDFDELTVDSWDAPVLACAKGLGWYAPKDD